MRLEGKVAIITGAGYGIGRGIAVRFAGEGADVVVAYGHDKVRAEQTAALVRDAGRRALVVKCDVRSSVDVGNLVNAARAELGRIDVLVNNAGIVRVTPFLEISEDEWEEVIGIDLKGCFLCAQAVARMMVEKGIRGRIIHIGSVQGERPLPGRVHYGAAKSGLRGMMKVMAFELAPHGITVNLVEPGATMSDMLAPFMADPDFERQLIEWIPMHRIGTPEDVAALLVFLASPEAEYVSGAVIPVDGALLTSPHMV